MAGTIALIYLAVLVAPALLLAYRGRMLGLSLALLLVPDGLLLAAFTL